MAVYAAVRTLTMISLRRRVSVFLLKPLISRDRVHPKETEMSMSVNALEQE